MITSAGSSTIMPSGSHKRKHSTLSDKNMSTNSAANLLNSLASRGLVDDEDSSSSWASSSHPGLYMGMPPSKKAALTLSSHKKGGTPSASSSASRQQMDTGLLGLLTGQSGSGSTLHGSGGSGGGGGIRRPSVNNRLTASGLPVKQRRDRNKNRARTLVNTDYDDESSNLAEEFYQSDETGDEEGASESGAGGELARNFNNEDDLMTSDEDNLDDDFDQMGGGSGNKFKLSKQNSGVHGRRSNKEDAGSGEDNNEKYCICKDVSYGDMVMCDNRRVILKFSTILYLTSFYGQNI
jgi:hypothetical protein